METNRPLFWQYTHREEQKHFIPPGFTRSKVAFKEFLDNASDSAETNGGPVLISIRDDRYFIVNNGIIPRKMVFKIKDFSNLFSTKYLKRGFQRGQVGHGLKLAIMMVISHNKNITLRTNGVKFVIKLVNRLSRNPKTVIDIDEYPDDDFLRGEASKEMLNFFDSKTTSFEFYCDDDSLSQYLTDYVIANPHIHFFINDNFSHKEYKATVDAQKSDKFDIHSYDLDDFDSLVESYNNPPLKDFLALFNQGIPRCSASGYKVPCRFSIPRSSAAG